MVGARVATAADAAAVTALRADAVAEARSKRGGDALMDGALGEPADAERSGVVGLIGSAVVGFATVERRGAIAMLTELFTHPEARGVGVGDAMLGEISTMASQWGCVGLDSVALPGDRDTKNFFESHAMKSRLLIVHRPL